MTAAKPEISNKKSFSAIWLIPVIALAMGAWMVAQAFLTEGPEIRIIFKTASGLAEGKTKVKFRNVEMGIVQEVILSDDLEHVIAIVKLKREAIPLLGDDTRFWLVSARIQAGNISGLDTLLSGAYIEISPGENRSKLKQYTALEQPPLTPLGAPGVRLVLNSKRSPSVGAGDPVLFKGYKVGRVESFEFDPEAKQIRYTIFIDAPYHSLVTSSVRFWDVSGVSVSAGAAGFQVTTGSVETILLGGVTFAPIPDLGPGELVEHDTEFKLFANYADILKVRHKHRAYFVGLFDQSIKGLSPGGRVEYRGIQVGKVERIMIEQLVKESVKDGGGTANSIPVLVSLEPARLGLPDTAENAQVMRSSIIKGVANGLRFTLASGSLLGGAQVVDVEYYDDAPPAKTGEYATYTTIPTITSGFKQIEIKVSTLLDKLHNLPVEDMMGSVSQSVLELNQTLAALRTLLEADSSRNITIEMEKTLVALRELLEKESTQEVTEELNKTLAAARYQLEGESTGSYQLVTTLKEVETAARSLREFLHLLEVKPEALIRGKSDTGGQ
jgi:paraquat-inducible protein B